ncbi:MAG TPA: hypothetical protein VG456_17545 [Candidatus Sulfopaludibacter sp.]|jgi:hypothetical protein|nr:hypothetical protein [Candidatus Sulfopaludibacter sp.]
MPDQRAKIPLEQMTPDEQADYLHQKGIESGNRYAGNPELLLKEHPHRNFRNTGTPQADDPNALSK